MSNHSTIRPVNPRTWSPTNARPSIGHSAGKPRRISALLGAAAALAIGTTVFAGIGQAEAAVRPVPAVAAHPGPITTPSGAVRCGRPGQWHATVPVRTTKTTAGGRHIASVQIQYQYGGRSTLAGQASSKTAVTRVVICVSPARIQGNYGPVRGIASDVVDGGSSRSFILTFHR